MSLHRLGFLALASYVAAFTLLGPAGCSSASHDATGPATTGPQVTLIANPTSVTSVAQIVLSASVTDGNGGTVQKVEFYERIIGVDASPRKIGEDSQPPYAFARDVQSSADNGTREYTAKAYDAAQHVGISNAVMVAVKLATDTPMLSPGVYVSQTSITTPGQIRFTVVTDKAVARIEVDNGDAKVAELVPQSQPYVVSVPVTSANNGKQTYAVKAYDATGNVIESAAMDVVVDIQWDVIRTIPDIQKGGAYGPFVVTDADGAVYVAGDNEVETPVRHTDGFLIKHDADGNRLWIRTFGGSNTQHVDAAGVDGSGRVYIAGDVYSGVGLRKNCFLNLFDRSGATVRTQIIDIQGWSKDSCVAASDAAGNFYVAGSVSDSANGVLNIFIVKYDKDGGATWTRQFRSQPDTTFAFVSGIAVDPLGGVYVVGFTNGSIGGSPSGGAFDLFLVKYDGDGNRLWARQAGQVGHNTQGVQLAPDPDGGVYVLGNAYDSEIRATVLVLRTGADGTIRWVRSLSGHWSDQATGIAVDRRGVYVVGYTLGPPTVPGVPPDGEIREAAQGDWDAFLAKLSPDGSLLSVRLLGTPVHDGATGVAVGSNGKIYVSGLLGGFYTPILARDPNVVP
ncbi:MAG: SBBP repeat-containing protein [Gemmatimonadaceae bacterium]